MLSEQEKKNIQEMYGLISEQGDKENTTHDPDMRKDFGSVENMASDKITINGQTMPLQKLKANVRTSKSGRESSNLGPVKVGSDLIFIGALQPKEIKTGDVSNVGYFLTMNGNALNRAMGSFFFWFETEGTSNKYSFDSEQYAKDTEARPGESLLSAWLNSQHGPKQNIKKYFELAGNPCMGQKQIGDKLWTICDFSF